MSLNAKKAGGSSSNKQRIEQPVIEEGTYPGRVVQVVDLGIQNQRPYKGEEKPPVHKIHVTYEMVDEFMVDEEGNIDEEKPRWLSEEFPLYNLKNERANSTKRYMAIDPNLEVDGDWGAVASFPVNIVVGTYVPKSGPNEGKTRNKVVGLTKMRPKEVANCPELVNEPKVFSLDDPDMDVFNSLPEFMQEKIKGNLEYNGSPLQELLEGGSKPKAKKPEPTPEPEEKDEDEAPQADIDDTDEEMPW